MLVELITPEEKLFEGEISSIKLPGETGEFEMLNNHAPIVSSLTKGEIRIIDNTKKTEVFTINGGVVEMQNNKIIILVD